MVGRYGARMSDDNPMPPGADDNDGPRAFGIPLPPELGAMLAGLHREHDAQHARADVAEADAWRFAEGLDAEGLRVLAWILRVGTDGDYAIANNARWLGITEAIMRGRGLDPSTGKPWGAELVETPTTTPDA